MKRSQKFIVSVPVVPGVTKARMAEYIRDSVAQMSGCFEPPYEGNGFKGDPLFGAFYGGPTRRCKVAVKPMSDFAQHVLAPVPKEAQS